MDCENWKLFFTWNKPIQCLQIDQFRCAILRWTAKNVQQIFNTEKHFAFYKFINASKKKPQTKTDHCSVAIFVEICVIALKFQHTFYAIKIYRLVELKLKTLIAKSSHLNLARPQMCAIVHLCTCFEAHFSCNCLQS